MRVSHEAVAGPLIIAALLTGGLFYARAPGQRWPELHSNAGATIERSFPPITICDASWMDNRVVALGTLGSGGPLFLQDAEHASGRSLIGAGMGSPSSACFASDCRSALVGTCEGRLWWIDCGTNAPPRQLFDRKRKTIFSALAVADDGAWIAAGTADGSAYIGNPIDPTSPKLLPGGSGNVRDLRFSADGSRLAGAYLDGTVRVWSTTTGELFAQFALDQGGATAAAFLPDGERIIAAGSDGTVRLCGLAGQQEIWRHEAGPLRLTALTVSRCGSRAAWGGLDHTLVVWNLKDSQIEFEIDVPIQCLARLKFTPDGSLLLAGENIDEDGAIYIYDLQQGGAKRLSLNGNKTTP